MCKSFSEKHDKELARTSERKYPIIIYSTEKDKNVYDFENDILSAIRQVYANCTHKEYILRQKEWSQHQMLRCSFMLQLRASVVGDVYRYILKKSPNKLIKEIANRKKNNQRPPDCQLKGHKKIQQIQPIVQIVNAQTYQKYKSKDW